jgi:hypothetical protein
MDGGASMSENNRALTTRGIHVAVAVRHATVHLLDED